MKNSTMYTNYTQKATQNKEISKKLKDCIECINKLAS